MNHPSTCLPRESGIQGCRSPTLGIQPHRAPPDPRSLRHSSTSAHRFPHHQPCHQLTTVVWDLPKANGVALRIRRHASRISERVKERRRWRRSEAENGNDREGGCAERELRRHRSGTRIAKCNSVKRVLAIQCI